MNKVFGIRNLQFSLEEADKHEFQLNEKGILGEREKNISRNKKSLVGEFKMNGT